MVAAPPGHEDQIESAVAEAAAGSGLAIEVIGGGATRAESVGLGLARVDSELVVVHDAARPLTAAALIAAVIESLEANPAAAGVIAATAVTDTVKRVAAGEREIAGTVDRATLWAAQTPQAFRTEALRRAHDTDPEQLAAATDDAMLVELAGGQVLIEPAPADNLKVTTPADLQLAELLLASRP